jgi:hypothetical protein
MPSYRTLLVLLALAGLALLPMSSRAQVIVGVSITVAPPALPVYVQPAIPGPRYIWVPGYWAWGDDDYYWVPGTWVLAPADGLLWTPGYWGWRDGIYVWNAGYWGPRIGFYGGINYGFGYTGVGYQGGYWNGGVFVYNRTVNNFGSVHITNVYTKTVVVNSTAGSNVSFNGGAGGTTARPTAAEQAAAGDKHISPTELQVRQQRTASTNHALFASVNHGTPAIAATARAGQFSGAGVVGARGAQTLGKTLNTGAAGLGGAKGASTFHSRKSVSPPKDPRPNFQKASTGQPKKPEQHAKRPVGHP